MHRIDCPTATPDNKFTEGDPTIPVAATTVTADWLNAVQEELAAVIASAELSLDKANNAQLLQALHKILDIRAPLATLLRAGLMQPDGMTVTVDEDGLLQALGGNLLLNSWQWITESGTFVAPVASWYELLLFHGGHSGAAYTTVKSAQGGWGSAINIALVYLTAGEEVLVTIGAGGVANADGSPGHGGETTFGDIMASTPMSGFENNYSPRGMPSGVSAYAMSGSGFGGGCPGGVETGKTQAERNAVCNARGHFGAGGAAVVTSDGLYAAGAGAQGSVLALWHDPAKAAGPLPAPALFSARRVAPRTAAQPATVNLYDPETGQGSVWREEDAEAKLAEGLISEEAWLAICEAKAAEERAAWLADPETAAERFGLLQQACAAKLAETDKYTMSDYPIQDETRAEVDAYRKAIRELNHQPGAPWDGGGELTPWPEMPAVTKVQEA